MELELASTEGFFRYHLIVGTIIGAELNPKAKKPAYHLTVDFGAYGIKESSAQLTLRYQESTLIGRQIVGVLNFFPKRIAGVQSEVLVLGAMVTDADVVLLALESPVPNGTRIG
ncbi:MAG: tRNA-binding protein [Sulfobacillus sp.]